MRHSSASTTFCRTRAAYEYETHHRGKLVPNSVAPRTFLSGVQFPVSSGFPIEAFGKDRLKKV
jgi:hypothetical protein